MDQLQKPIQLEIWLHKDGRINKNTQVLSFPDNTGSRLKGGGWGRDADLARTLTKRYTCLFQLMKNMLLHFITVSVDPGPILWSFYVIFLHQQENFLSFCSLEPKQGTFLPPQLQALDI